MCSLFSSLLSVASGLGEPSGWHFVGIGFGAFWPLLKCFFRPKRRKSVTL